MTGNKIFQFPPVRLLLKLSGLAVTIVDIGNEEIRLIEAVKAGPYFTILRMKSEKKPSDFNNPQKFELFLKRLGLPRGSSFILTFSLSSINAIPLSFPGIAREKLASMLNWELEKKLPLPMKDVQFAYKIMENNGAGGLKTWNITALILKKEEVRTYLSLFGRSGRTIDKIFLLPLHILNIFNTNKSADAIGYIIWSKQTIEIYLFLNKSLYQFILYSGHFAEMNKIAVRNITDYFQSFQEQSGRPLKEIILCNKGNIPADQIEESIGKTLDIKVSEANESNLCPELQKINTDKAYYDLTGFIKKPVKEMNISPPGLTGQFYTRLILKSAARILILLTLASIVFIPFIINTGNEYALFIKAKNEAALNDQNEETRKLALQIKQAEELKLLIQKQDELIKKIEVIKTSGFASSHLRMILTEIARIIPDDVKLKNLQISGIKGEMEGFSYSSGGLDDFVGRLSRSNRLKDIILKSADLTQEKGKSILSFKISFGAEK